jgi:hypothetical protein
MPLMVVEFESCFRITESRHGCVDGFAVKREDCVDLPDAADTLILIPTDCRAKISP